MSIYRYLGNISEIYFLGFRITFQVTDVARRHRAEGNVGEVLRGNERSD